MYLDHRIRRTIALLAFYEEIRIVDEYVVGCERDLLGQRVVRQLIVHPDL